MSIFVQLPHPSGEPPTTFISSGICPANSLYNGKSHFRKFLLTRDGSFASNKGKQFVRHNNQCFTFWGEWEHSSTVTFFKPPISPSSPSQLHVPQLPASSSAAIPCNNGKEPCSDGNQCASGSHPCQTSIVESTDPFVFCEPMLYFCCGIYGNKGNNKLNKLSRGDIVVFGSTLGTYFVVDTVFVVADRVSVHDPKLCKLFKDANRAYFSTKPCVYRGATFADKVDGMFSFFPALPCLPDGTPQPFARPILTLPNFLDFTKEKPKQLFINPESKRRYKISESKDNVAVWQEIVNEITSKNEQLVLGLCA